MCWVDPLWVHDESPALSRRGFLGTGVAAGLAAATADWGRALLLPGTAEGAETPPRSGGPGTSGVRFRWLGTNGWEISFGSRTLLFDPWLSRSVQTGFLAGRFDPKTPLKVEEALIDQHIRKADQILIGHGHWDHLADVPYIQKKTSAQVIGSETHANLLRAFGTPEIKIVPVKGGEYMQFDGYTIEVFPAVHSMGPTKKFAVPGHLYSVPSMPTTVGELPEGDSLIYLITIRGTFRIFLMSTANYVERAIAGLRPDVALVASLFSNQIYAYTPRLLRALNYPPILLATHWDNFERPFTEPPQDLRALFGDPANLDLWVKEVKQLSPRSKVVTMKYFESFTP
jgi:L-ascorbate metabolism protein UlaG (beta-lactamase superfamily)